MQLSAMHITDELDTMWKTMHKLSNEFSKHPGPNKVAITFKSKIDDFKQHIPMLSIICNPGIKARHWETVSSLPTSAV